MTAEPINWVEGEFVRLNESLVAALAGEPGADGRLQTLLANHRPAFAALLEEPPRDRSLLEALGKGRVTINGGKHPADAIFCQSVARLADLLDINESRAAALYNTALLRRAHLGDVSNIEAAVIMYYTERESLLSRLETMVNNAVVGPIGGGFGEINDYNMPNQTIKTISDFLWEFLPQDNSTIGDENQTEPSSTISIPARLIKLVNSTSQKLEALGVAWRSGDLVPPSTSQQQAGNTNIDAAERQENQNLVTLCILRISRERAYALSLLSLFAHKYCLTASELALIINTLQKTLPSTGILEHLVCIVLSQFDQTSPRRRHFSSRYVLDEAVYAQTRDSIVNSNSWEYHPAYAVTSLAWLNFLDQFVRLYAASESLAKNIISPDLKSMRKIWSKQFGSNPDTYELLRSCMHLSRDSTDSAADQPNLPIIGSPLSALAVGPIGPTALAASLADPSSPSSAGPVTPDDIAAQTDELCQEISKRASLAIDNIARNFIVRMHQIRQIMQHGQDTAANQERQLAQMQNSQQNGMFLVQKTLTGWEALLQLLSDLYHGHPDIASDWFKTEYLVDILKLGSEAYTPRYIVAFLDLLAAISSGPECALHVHNILSNDVNPDFGQILWSTFFRTLNGYISRLSQSNQSSDSITELLPAEADLIGSFLRLLNRVVRHSVSARRALCENQQFPAPHLLFQLLVCRIHVELKAALLTSIAAFCQPTEETADIVREIWMLLERSQIIPTLPVDASSLPYATPKSNMVDRRTGKMMKSASIMSTGIGHDLLEIEIPMQTYPETRALLHLLVTLLSNPKSPIISAVYEHLGSPDRVGGIRPYIAFVIDGILMRLGDLSFVRPIERWQVTESCFKIVKMSCELFDISELMMTLNAETTVAAAAAAASAGGGVGQGGVSGVGGNTSIMTAAPNSDSGIGAGMRLPTRALALQPGFDVYCRILQGSRFTNILFDVLHRASVFVSADGTIKTVDDRPVGTISSILCIIHHILKHQGVFLEISAQGLSEYGDIAALNVPASMVGLDQLIAYNKHVVIDIVSLVRSVDGDICRSSIKILSLLSNSTVFSTTSVSGGANHASGSIGFKTNRLVSIILESEESNRILQAFVDRLEIDEAEERRDDGMQETAGGVQGDAYSMGDRTMQMGDDPMAFERRATSDGRPPTIQYMIVDLLLQNIKHNAPPNLAHFLLGYNCQRDIASTELIDPAAPGSRVNCLHAILALLARGTLSQPRWEDGNQKQDGAGDRPKATRDPPLWATHPLLNERCFALVYHLCCDRHTGGITMRYLRTREDFFHRQLLAMDANALHTAESSGSTDVRVARYHHQSWLMRTVALELHMTMLSSQRSHAARLINHLLGLSNGMGGFGGISDTARASLSFYPSMDASAVAYDASESMQPDLDYDQPLPKILDILKHLDFSKPDTIDPAPQFEMLGINVSQYKLQDPHGMQQFDVSAVYLALLLIVRQMERHARFGGVIDNSRGGNGDTGADSTMSMGASFDRRGARALVHNLFEINERFRISSSRYDAAMAWGQLVRVAMIECVDIISPDHRELRTFELLAGLLEKLSRSDASMVEIGKDLSTVVIALMSRIQQDSRVQLVLKDTPPVMDPGKLDSWQQTILRGILDGVLGPGTSVEMRGNYYSALVTFVQYICPTGPGDAAAQSGLVATGGGSSVGGGLAGSFMTPMGAADASGKGDMTNAMHMSGVLVSLNLISGYGDRLIEAICRDACDSMTVWQTVAFATLGSLCGLYNLEATVRGAKFNPVVDFLVRRNFLSHFVETLKTVDDHVLRSLVSTLPTAGASTLSEEEALKSKYIYDMKMALLLKIAESKSGADRLVNAGLFEVFAGLHFVSERPDYGAVDIGPEHERYHDALIPILQTVLSIQSHYQPTNAVMRARTMQFVDAHREVFGSVLRDRSRTVTLATLVQIRLVTHILTWMRHERGLLTRRLPGPGQTSLETLVMQLVIKYVFSDQWQTQVVPSNPIEEEKTRTVPAKMLASVSAPTVFAGETLANGEDVAAALLAYCIERDTMEGFAGRLGDGGASSVPGASKAASALGLGPDECELILTHASAMLQRYGDRLAKVAARRTIIQTNVADISHVPMDDINEIAQSFNPSAFEEMSPSQRQNLALRELTGADRNTEREMRRLRMLVEMAALLVLLAARRSVSTATSGADGEGGHETNANAIVAHASATSASAAAVLERILAAGHGDGFLQLCVRGLQSVQAQAQI